MDKAKLLDQAKATLSEVYDEYRRQGIMAIYLWGSITRSDFDPKTSDIDVICIVSDDFPKQLNQTIRKELNRKDPKQEWGFQIIYLVELNGGPIRSRLAEAMSPESILPSFDDWYFVYGQRFARTDFSVEDASPKRRVELNIKEIRKRFSDISKSDDYHKIRNRKGIVKTVLILVHNRQLDRGVIQELNYNNLLKHADQTEQQLVRKVLKYKENNQYDKNSFTRITPVIEGFVEQVEKDLKV